MLRFNACAALLAVALSCACARDPAAEISATESPGYAMSPAAPARAATSNTGASPALPDFASLVERYGRAVVNVDVVGSMEIPAARTPGDEGLLEFFRNRRSAGVRGTRRYDVDARRGLGIHREPGRLHPHECARRRRRG
jgi:S1-C subfamily serine protease